MVSLMKKNTLIRISLYGRRFLFCCARLGAKQRTELPQVVVEPGEDCVQILGSSRHHSQTRAAALARAQKSWASVSEDSAGAETKELCRSRSQGVRQPCHHGPVQPRVGTATCRSRVYSSVAEEAIAISPSGADDPVIARAVNNEEAKTVATRIAKASEMAARLGAILLVVVYGTGFLIVSLHHSAYGIAQFNLLKPRIFAAGVLFLFLTSIPVVAAARVVPLWKTLGETQGERRLHISL